MLIQNYGIRLSSLKASDLEMVRVWRNTDFIRNQMLYQEYISSSMQEKWFQSLDSSSIYLMIQSTSEKIGLINIKNIDKQLKTGEAGIFVGHEKYRNTMPPILAILALMDAAFHRFNFRTLFAKVLKNNQSALTMNLELGYKVVKEYETYTALEITANDYEKNTALWKSKMKKFYFETPLIELTETEKKYLPL